MRERERECACMCECVCMHMIAVRTSNCLNDILYHCVCDLVL